MGISYQQVCNDVMELINRAKHVTFDIAEESNLTKAQLFLLYALDRNGEVAMGTVACVLHCDASNVTGIVDRLVAHGLVSRNESPQDRRTKILTLTTRGKEVVKSIQQSLMDRLGCAKLDDSEREALHGIIAKLNA